MDTVSPVTTATYRQVRTWHRRHLFRRVGVTLGGLAIALGGPGAHAFSKVFAAPLFTISGIVETSDGHPVTDAPVSLSIMPGSALPKTPSPTVYIAQTVSGSDGSFSIPAPTLSTSALAQAASNDGWLNMELDSSAMIGTEDGQVMYLGGEGVSALVLPSKVSAAPIGTVRSTPNHGLLLLYGYKGLALSEKSTVDNELAYVKQCVNGGLSCFKSSSPSNSAAIDNQCGQNWYSIDNSPYFQPVGEYHTWDDMSGHFEYGQTASTSLGVAFNYESGDGWSVEGSVYMGTTNSMSAPLGTQGSYFAHQIMGEFGWEMDESDTPCQGRSIYRIEPLDWTGGLSIGPSIGGDGPNNYNSVNPNYHADYGQGVGTDPSRPITKNSGTGYQYGVQAQAFGITVGAETDYSNNVEMDWTMGTAGYTWHSLFSYGAPPASANSQLIFASDE